MSKQPIEWCAAPPELWYPPPFYLSPGWMRMRIRCLSKVKKAREAVVVFIFYFLVSVILYPYRRVFRSRDL